MRNIESCIWSHRNLRIEFKKKKKIGKRVAKMLAVTVIGRYKQQITFFRFLSTAVRFA